MQVITDLRGYEVDVVANKSAVMTTDNVCSLYKWPENKTKLKKSSYAINLISGQLPVICGCNILFHN